MIISSKACKKHELETTLCGCCSDCGLCWYGFCCTPIASGCAWAMARGEKCTCFHLCEFPFFTRANIRHARGMDMSYCSDFCQYCCCPTLFTIQNLREIKLIQAEALIPDRENTTVVVNNTNLVFPPPQNGPPPPSSPPPPYPGQSYPDQPYLGQPYPNQGYTNQGYPNQAYPNQEFSNQPYPPYAPAQNSPYQQYSPPINPYYAPYAPPQDSPQVSPNSPPQNGNNAKSVPEKGSKNSD